MYDINTVRNEEASKFLKNIDGVDLIYLDPPFNTGKVQKSRGNKYKDIFENHGEYLCFIIDIAQYSYSALKSTGSLLFHIDYREVHYCKIILDEIFGRECFMNEIIWCYDYGGRSKKKYSCKHDTILWYVKDSENYTFNYDKLKRIPYMSDAWITEEKKKKGKTIVDWQFHTIVPTNSKERVDYPTQKPLGLLEQFVKVHSNVGDLLVDPMCGGGSFGVSAKRLGRKYLLNDENKKAVKITEKRLSQA